MSWVVWFRANMQDPELERKLRDDVARQMSTTIRGDKAKDQVEAAVDVALFALRHHKVIGASELLIELAGHSNPGFLTVTLSAA